jgi:hypothetical protein
MSPRSASLVQEKHAHPTAANACLRSHALHPLGPLLLAAGFIGVGDRGIAKHGLVIGTLSGCLD